VRAERGEDQREAWLTIAPCDRDGACAALAAPEDGPAFFAEADAGGFARELAAEAGDGALRIALRTDAEGLGARLRGVARLTGADGAPVALAIDEPLLGSGAAAANAGAHVVPNTSDLPTAPAAGSAPAALLAMLGLALLGGLVLNLMPCVLPVLALKVFAVSELAGQSRRDALRHGLAYAAGIELSMLALAAVALALRGAGHAVGWGFQFQEPAYVAAISAVLTGFALNLFGVFEIGFQPSALASVGAEASGARRSFFEGLLAVALATPCSAPFLGTALGFAFASSGFTIALVFVAIGAGLALPFVAISAFPRLARFLPRSGAWMGALRSGLGFALLASVVWLLWVVGRGAGADAAIGLLAVLLAGAFVAWIYGRLQHAGARFAGAGAALAVAALVLGGANWVRVSGVRRPADEAVQHAEAEAWSPLALEQALAAGKPAFVYFTADWCLTCKLNERLAIDTAETRALLEQGEFAVMRGDWTQRDETIRAELARHGKAGVPLYLVYAPSAPDAPQVLSELLTQERLSEALRAAAAPRR
jgi:thiol:disulfide interchange protein DsbD